LTKKEILNSAFITSYERDKETNLDFAQARYYSKNHGRFSSPDDVFNDTNPFRPQSWNLYSYVRNNPLRLVDPNGEKAKVHIERDKKTKTGTIEITASFVVYAADGQDVSEEELNKQKELIQEQLESVYSGSYKAKDGYTYTISAKITVDVKSSESDAIKSGADNIVEVGNKGIFDTQAKTWSVASSYHVKGEKFDRMKVSVLGRIQSYIINTNVYGHEFSHLLGSSLHPPQGNVIFANGNDGPRSFLNDYDKTFLFAPQIKQLTKDSTRWAPTINRNQKKWQEYTKERKADLLNSN
jgi:RHS repeat-associated protein